MIAYGSLLGMGAGPSVFVEVDPDERAALLLTTDDEYAPVELVDERQAKVEEIDEGVI